MREMEAGGRPAWIEATVEKAQLHREFPWDLLTYGICIAAVAVFIAGAYIGRVVS